MPADAGLQGQVNRDAAAIYDGFFVPALFQEWAPRLCDAARLQAGQRVLDLACGSGVLARAAAERVGGTGRVTGLDRNPGMLAVARRRAPGLDWREGRAETLPFADATFDAVVSQFGLMFFDDPAAALSEAWRVLRPGGRLAVAVWADLAETPGYRAMTALLDRLFGPAIAGELRAPYALGDPAALRRLFAAAGIAAAVRLCEGEARFPSLGDWVTTDIKGWTLADRLDEAQVQVLLAAAPAALAAFVQADGSVAFRHPALLATAGKPS
jgi:SAM-dependent methyltransferase